MKIVKTEIIEEDGTKYKVYTYDNGAVVKVTYSDEPIPEPEPIESEPTTEEILADIQINTDYLVCLAEINNE